MLSSREQSCVNTELKELGGRDKGFECRRRVARQQGRDCAYYKTERFYQEELKSGSGKVMDL